MHRLFVPLTAVVIILHWCSTATAQLVQVGPGFVKAPFVRVYWGPDGSSYVRAPFVKVFSSGHHPVHWIEATPLPEPDDFAEMDWQELRDSIRRLAVILDADLDRFQTGDLWRVELKTAEIRALMHGDGPPIAAEATKLETLLHRYDATRATPAARAIWRLRSFQALHAALSEYTALPEERLRRQLSRAAEDLYLALDEIPTGAGWQKYLALPKVAVSDGSNESAVDPAEPDVRALEGALDRFDSVSRNDEYRAIAQMPEFREARVRLAAYLAHVRNSPPGQEQFPEELPAPESPQR